MRGFMGSPADFPEQWIAVETLFRGICGLRGSIYQRKFVSGIVGIMMTHAKTLQTLPP